MPSMAICKPAAGFIKSSAAVNLGLAEGRRELAGAGPEWAGLGRAGSDAFGWVDEPVVGGVEAQLARPVSICHMVLVA